MKESVQFSDIGVLMATETPSASTGELQEFEACIRFELGSSALSMNGYQLQQDKSDAYGRLQGVAKEYGISEGLFVRAMGIPTITVDTLTSMDPVALEELVSAIEDAGGVPLLGS